MAQQLVDGENEYITLKRNCTVNISAFDGKCLWSDTDTDQTSKGFHLVVADGNVTLLASHLQTHHSPLLWTVEQLASLGLRGCEWELVEKRP